MTLTIEFDDAVGKEVVQAICAASSRRPNAKPVPEAEQMAFAVNYLRQHALVIAHQQAVHRAQAEAKERLR